MTDGMDDLLQNIATEFRFDPALVFTGEKAVVQDTLRVIALPWAGVAAALHVIGADPDVVRPRA